MFRRRKRPSADFNEEIASHLAHATDELQANGMSREEAEAAAHRQFGNVLQTQERFYEQSRWMVWDEFKRDFGFALRLLKRSPACSSHGSVGGTAPRIKFLDYGEKAKMAGSDRTAMLLHHFSTASKVPG